MGPLDTPARRLLKIFEGYQEAADELTRLTGDQVYKQNVQYWVQSDFIPPQYWRVVSQLVGMSIDEFLDHAEARAKLLKQRKGSMQVRKSSGR